MVSILSFFTKKRPKASTSPQASTPDPAGDSRRNTTPPLSHAKAASGTVSRATRGKSTRAAKDRRASLDSYGFARRGKSGSGGIAPASTVAAAPPRITLDLPFDLPDGSRAGGARPAAATAAAAAGTSARGRARASLSVSHSISLGLDHVGGTPVITAAERRVLDSQRYTPDDLRVAWDWLGREVRQRGAETVGIMLPRRFENSKDKQRQLSVLFVLARRPELAEKFPSVANLYPAPSEREAAGVWKARLVQVAKDTENPVDIAETLKAVLRRLAGKSRPIIDPSVYIRFVQQEHAASYPRNAYATMLLPHLSDEVAGLLDAVLEVCNAIAMHAENNAMSAGRLAHLIGWWLLGKLPDGISGWNALYDEYKLAGQRAEHLFYARIRWQSTQQKMPRRLVQLILSYPFGESSASSEHLPLPPASTFARRVLHVSLGTDTALPVGTDPVKVLGDAIIAKVDTRAEAKADEWEALRKKDGKPVTLEDLLSHESQVFLEEVSSAKGIEFTSPPVVPVSLPDDDGRFHPFAEESDRIVTSQFSLRRRSSSYGDVPRVEVSGSKTSSLLDIKTDGSSPRKSVSSHNLSPPSKATPPAWDDFASRGFAASPDADRISLALTKPVSPKRDSASAGLQPPKKIIVKGSAPSTSLVVAGEEIINVDDGFIYFVEDAQLDPVSSSSWPRFALVQLNQPFPTNAPEGDAVSWLLVTVKKRTAVRRHIIEEPVPDIRSQLTRPMSPGGESSMSRLSSTFGLREIANTFRRSSLYSGRSGHRISTLNLKSSAGKGSDPLTPLRERGASSPPAHRDSGFSDAPTEYTSIGEMGEMVKVPTATELATIAAGGTPRTTTPVPSIAVEAAKPIMATSASDWVYLAEGGAHVVFRYAGSEPNFQGRALRIQKVAKQGTPDVAVRHVWAEKLLPMVLPAHLIPESTPATLDEKWTRALVTPTEIFRQSSRRAEGSLAQIVDYSRPAQLIDNLSAPIKGEKVLALEIKPKWGFLPSATNLTPQESILIKTRNCRFCLHSHYRGEYDEAGYCPLDLYSGEPARVHRALDNLWKAWRASGGDKNNLRVFVDGNKVLPKDAHLIPTSGDDLPEGSYALIEPLLASSNVLGMLKKLQSTLDPHDISSLAQDFGVEYPSARLFDPELVPEPTISELTDFVALYKRGEVNWTLRQRQIAYGLSAIFKDCSIMVRAVLQPTSDGYILVNDSSMVKVIDTDLKPLASLGHWAELDDKLWRHWSKTMGDSVVVIDNKKSQSVNIDSQHRPATPISRRASVSPAASPSSSPLSAGAVIAAAAVAAGAGATALSVITPKSSPSKPMASPVPSIPDMEDATSALKRVVDVDPAAVAAPELETLSDEPKPEATTEPVLETKARETEVKATVAAEPEVAQPEVKTEVPVAEVAPAPLETENPVAVETAPAEENPAAPAAENKTPVVLAATAVAVTTATTFTAAVETPASTDETPALDKQKASAVHVQPTPAVEKAVEEPIPDTASSASPAIETKTAPDSRVITRDIRKPAPIDLTAAKQLDDASSLTPMSVVEGADVPPGVDFEADPFVKAPVVLRSHESRTSLASPLASPGVSVSNAEVPTPVATFVSPTTTHVPTAETPAPVPTPAPETTIALLSSPSPEPTPTSPQKPASRVRDKIKAFENKDMEHKSAPPKPIVSPRRQSAFGLSGVSQDSAPSPLTLKKPTKKNSFGTFIRKASATFEGPKSDSRKVSGSSAKEPEPKVAAAAPLTSPAAPREKERGVNPFGSLRSKKKQAATAGAAAIAATATVATATLAKDEKETSTPATPPVAESTVASKLATATEVGPPTAASPPKALSTLAEAAPSEAAPALETTPVPVIARTEPTPATTAPAETIEVVEEAKEPLAVDAPAVAPITTDTVDAAISEDPVPVPIVTEVPVSNNASETPVTAETKVPATREAEVAAVSASVPAPSAPKTVAVETTPKSATSAAPVTTAGIAAVAAIPIAAVAATKSANEGIEPPVEATVEVSVVEAVPQPAPESPSAPAAVIAEESTPVVPNAPPVVAEVLSVPAGPSAEDPKTSVEAETIPAAERAVVPTPAPKELAPVIERSLHTHIPTAINTATRIADDSSPTLGDAVTPRTEAISPGLPAMPESAVLPKEALPLVGSAALVGLGFGAITSHDETEELNEAKGHGSDGLDLSFNAEDGKGQAGTAIAPAPVVRPIAAEVAESIPTPETIPAATSAYKKGFSAVTPEFTAPPTMSPPLDVVHPLRCVSEVDEEALDSSANEINSGPIPTGVAASSRLVEEKAAKPINRAVSPIPVKSFSRSASPIPGPPENVAMYQNASLPPLPGAAISGANVETESIASSATVGTGAGIVARGGPASESTTSVATSAFLSTTGTAFATAPDTHIASEMDHDETPSLDLPELAAFSKRMGDRAHDDRRTSQQTFGSAIDYRTSVHTFGGTQSEAAWLNGIAKSRLSMDETRPTHAEIADEKVNPATHLSVPAAGALSHLEVLADAAVEKISATASARDIKKDAATA